MIIDRELAEKVKEITYENEKFKIVFEEGDITAYFIRDILGYELELIKFINKETIAKFLKTLNTSDIKFYIELFKRLNDNELKDMVRSKLKDIDVESPLIDIDDLIEIYKENIIEREIMLELIYRKLKKSSIGDLIEVIKNGLGEHFKEFINTEAFEKVYRTLVYNFTSTMKKRYTSDTEIIEEYFKFLSLAKNSKLLTEENIMRIQKFLMSSGIEDIIKRRMKKEKYHELLMNILEFLPNLSKYANYIVVSKLKDEQEWLYAWRKYKRNKSWRR